MPFERCGECDEFVQDVDGFCPECGEALGIDVDEYSLEPEAEL